MRSGSVIVRSAQVTRSRRMRVGEIGRGIGDIRIRHLVGDSAHLTQRIVGPAIIAPLLELIDQKDIALLADHGVDRRRAAPTVVMTGFAGRYAGALGAQHIRKSDNTNRASMLYQCEPIV